jgi:hypothetical protein
MFGFSSSSEPTLTPLAPRLSLRSTPTPPPPPSAASIFEEARETSPARSASVAPSQRVQRESIVVEEDAMSEWGAGGYAGLLSRDPRLSVDVCDAADGDARDHDARRGSMMALPGGGVAVAGTPSSKGGKGRRTKLTQHCCLQDLTLPSSFTRCTEFTSRRLSIADESSLFGPDS